MNKNVSVRQMRSTQRILGILTIDTKEKDKVPAHITDMISWRSLDGNLNIWQVRWALRLLYLAHILTIHVACDSDTTRPCSRPDPLNVRVTTVFSESVVRARLLAVHNSSGNVTGLTAAQFRVSRVFKRPRSVQITVFTVDVLKSDLQCVRINSSCLVFMNISTSIPRIGVTNISAVSGRMSQLLPWSRRSLRYVRMHICLSQYCSK